MTPVEELVAAREIIFSPQNWTKGVLARDAHGVEVDPFSEDAVCFCAYGALAKVRGKLDSWSDHLSRASWEINLTPPSFLNDGTDHPTVLRMFDLAISKARASEVHNG